MRMMTKLLFLIFLLSILLTSCSGENSEFQLEYEKCNAVCAAVLSDDFVTLELCREECSKKFLES